MSKTWFDQHLEAVQIRYLIWAGVFAILFRQICQHAVQEKTPLLAAFAAGYITSRIIGLVWRYTSNRTLVREFVERIPIEGRLNKRCQKTLEFIMAHERGLWIGWSNALGYVLIIDLVPPIPLILVAGFLIYTIWNHLELERVKKFIRRIEIHGWIKLPHLTHDEFLQTIDKNSLPFHRSSRFFCMLPFILLFV